MVWYHKLYHCTIRPYTILSYPIMSYIILCFIISYHRLPFIVITTYIWGCMCWTGPFWFRWLKGYIFCSCYYHPQIGSINLTHCYHIFPWLCASDVCYIIFCHLLHIHSGKPWILFLSLLCSLWLMQLVGYVLACRSYSIICTWHHLITTIV